MQCKNDADVIIEDTCEAICKRFGDEETEEEAGEYFV